MQADPKVIVDALRQILHQLEIVCFPGAAGFGNIADDLRNRFGSLPFAPRWIPVTDLNELKGAREYYELIEKNGEIVAQSEHTVIVNEEGCEVITR